MKKALPYILLAVLLVAALAIRRCRSVAKSKKDIENKIDRNTVLDRRPGFLEYTDHAKCRMDCGHITPQAVVYIFQNGEVNNNITETDARPCPVYALEGYTAAKQHLRIIVAQCDYKTKLVTCVNIDTPFDCGCTGAGIKYER
ncbi:MAG: DUF4258 domain-containing protein [Bacteroidota bacterium]